MSYHFTGFISAAIFLLTLWGLWIQMRVIWLRRKGAIPPRASEEAPTAVLSLNQFLSSYLAFYSFMLYGACLPRFNHYLVWPRLAAAAMTLWIISQLWRDRRDVSSGIAFGSGMILLALAPLGAWASPSLGSWGQGLAQGQVVFVTLILLQGYIHQVLVIRRSGRTGAVSLRMHQCFLLKDLSTIAFAGAMGMREGWPILLLSTVSAATKLITMWHFRWVRVSQAAADRRAVTPAGEPRLSPLA